MFNDGCLSKQTIAVVNKYLNHHGLRTASNKHCKANGGAKAYYSTTDTGFYTRRGKSTRSSENEEEYLSSDDESIQTDYVLAEIGSSSENDDEERDDIQITVTTTRSGRRATSYLR